MRSAIAQDLRLPTTGRLIFFNISFPVFLLSLFLFFIRFYLCHPWFIFFSFA